MLGTSVRHAWSRGSRIVGGDPARVNANLHHGRVADSTRRQTVIVAAVIALLFYGSRILNEALPAAAVDQASPGAPIEIGEGASITPLAGWAATAHDQGVPGIRLEKGIVTIDLYPESFGATAAELATGYLDEILRPDSTQLTASDVEVLASSQGAAAARFRYQGVFTGVEVPIEGEVTAVFEGGAGVIADAWTRQGDLAELLGEVRAMVESIQVAP